MCHRNGALLFNNFALQEVSRCIWQSRAFRLEPKQIHEWYRSVYIDAFEWVELPNTLGMSQFADGGVLSTKPYAASGNYINRMSNYCADCRYNYRAATGDDACPFTTLYWDFLDRHRQQFASNQRMNYQLRNLDRKDRGELEEIRRSAESLKQRVRDGERI